MAIEFNIDYLSLYESFLAFITQDPLTIAIQLFLKGGWVVILILFIYLLYNLWLEGRQDKFMGKWKFVVLAIDIPKNNEQTPKAVENIFTALAATQSGGNLIERFWEGKVQESFSFEIVSFDGYIQFLIRTPSHFRDLIEAAVYAQYPEVEITEVDDYTEKYKDVRFPNEDYNLWGTELVFVKDYPYPIKTYPDFEHSLSQAFLDPMAALLEVMSNFGPGEQLWLQLIVTPIKPDWGETAKKINKELKGESYSAPETFQDKLFKPLGFVSSFAIEIANQVLGGIGGGDSAKKEEDQWKMFKLTPGERVMFEKIGNKLSKTPFQAKFRMIYFGNKETFNKAKGVAATIGAIQQFNTADGNGFKPGKKSKTGADYFRVKKRVADKQNKILRYFIERNPVKGDKDKILMSNEELASIWHFPILTVKAPAIEKLSSRRSVPPTRLPYDLRKVTTAPIIEKEKKLLPEKEESVPKKPALPTIEDVIVERKNAMAKDNSDILSSPTSSTKTIIEKSEESANASRPTPPPNLPTV